MEQASLKQRQTNNSIRRSNPVNKIVIVIRENAVVAVDGIPIDVVIEVRNYDVAKVEKHKISRDTNGQEV
jgi:hypothetical protein